MTTNPYSPPRARIADTPEGEGNSPIWNPNAAANWSLLFSPAFGAFVHMLNWRTLGEDAKAASAKAWFIASLLILGFYVVLGFAVPNANAADAASRAIGLTFLIVWYFAAARGQAKYVNEKLGKTYLRKGWTKPLLIALLALVGYFVLIVAIAFLFGVVQQA